MNEVNLFKRSYFQGQMISIIGPQGTRKIRMAYEFLRHCHVDEHEVTSITAATFADDFIKNVSDYLIQGVRVFIVHQLDRVPLRKRKAFLQNLAYARRLYFTCGIRVILITSRKSNLHRHIQSQFPVMKIRVMGCTQQNIDERVHWALELACRVTQKRVTHLSVPAADFLETASEEFQDDGLLQTLIYGVHNSSRGILRLHDFFKSDKLKKCPPDEPATCCN